MNLYGFVGNEPNGWFDDLGNAPQTAQQAQSSARNQANRQNRQNNKNAEKARNTTRIAKEGEGEEYPDAPDAYEDLVEDLSEIIDAVNDPVSSLAEFSARRGAKNLCNKLFEEGGYKKGCACCKVTYKSSKVLHGGADPVTNWQVWSTEMFGKTCSELQKDEDKAQKEEEERRRKDPTRRHSASPAGGPNEYDIKFPDEKHPY